MTRLLLEWVITAALLIVAVIVLRALLGRRISAGLRYALWAAALIRLLVPLQFFTLPVPAVLPEMDREPIAANAAPAATVPALQGDPVGAPVLAAPQPSGVMVNHNAAVAPPAAVPDAARPWDALGWLWLAGTGVMAAAFLISNLIFALRLRRVRIPLEGADCPLPVYLAENLPSPCLFGLVRPAVCVTAEAAQDPAMLRHILAHEHTHFRHGDHVWNVLRSAALAIHWWNPLVWLAVVLSRRDCELACDEGALKRLGDGERVAYGRTLLALITVKPRPGDLLRCATTMTGGQKSVFDRVTRIARAPKRWLWAAVVAVIATALACVCAFGQAEEAPHPDDGDLPELTADLTFSLDESDPDRPVVRMDGTVGDLELTRGAFWEPPWQGMMTKKYPYGHLSMVYPPLTDGIERRVTAGWLDAGHTTVILTVEGMVMISSYAPSSWWDFAVDLNRGEVISMETPDFEAAGADGEVRRYPASISDEEALKAARIAAKLLTAAEDYYNNHHNSASEDLYAALPERYAKVLRGETKFRLYKNEPPISINEVPGIIDPYDAYMCLQQYAVVDLLGGQGSNETPQVLAYFCGVSGDMAGYLLLWDEDGEVHGEIFDSHGWRNRWFIDLKTDGTFECTDALGGHWWSSISYLRPTAGGSWALYSQAVRRGLDDSGKEIDLESFMNIEQELTEQEFEQALEVQRAKPDVTWHELPLKDYDGGPAPTQPVPLTGPSYTLDEYGTSVFITGLDCESACWYSRPLGASFDVPEHALGFLELWQPRFLSEHFLQYYSGCTALYSPEDDSDLVWIIAYETGTNKILCCTVNLVTHEITNQKISSPGWENADDKLPHAEMVQAAQTLSELIWNAADFYQFSQPAPEEGPLPFEVPMKMEFASGAGAWDTLITLHPDGSFEGRYHDMDMGDSGPGYQSTEYVCQFHGRFGEIRQVTGASWSLTLEELVLDTGRPIDEEWIEAIETSDGGTYNLRYISSDPYGFDTVDDGPLKPGAQFMFYTPDASGYRPADELYGMYMDNPDTDSIMYQFWTWMPIHSKIGAWGPDTKLGCYALCSMKTGRGFFSLEA